MSVQLCSVYTESVHDTNAMLCLVQDCKNTTEVLIADSNGQVW